MARLLAVLLTVLLGATAVASAQDPAPTTTTPPPATTTPPAEAPEEEGTDDLTITVPPEDVDTGEGIEIPAEPDEEPAARQAPSAAAPPVTPAPATGSAIQQPGTDRLADTGTSPLVPIGLGLLVALAGVALLRRRRSA